MEFNKIVLLYNNEENKSKELKFNPYGIKHVEAAIDAIEACLREKNYNTVKIKATNNLMNEISLADPDIIFNACYGIENKLQQASVAAMLERLEIPFTGSGLSAHILGLNKHAAKAIFRLFNIPTADYQVFITGDEPIESSLIYPLIIKPIHEGSGIGISSDSVVFNETELRKKVKLIISKYKQRALAEIFLEGREFTIGVMGNGSDMEVFPIKEIEFFNKHGNCNNLQTYDIKAVDAVKSICPSSLKKENPVLAKYLKDNAVNAFKAIGCRDFARLDIRMDKKGNPFFLEINTLPGLQPGYSDFPQLAKAAGYQYNDLIVKILEYAWKRYN